MEKKTIPPGGLMRPMAEAMNGKEQGSKADEEETFSRAPVQWEVIDGYQYTGGDPTEESSWLELVPHQADVLTGKKEDGPWKKFREFENKEDEDDLIKILRKLGFQPKAAKDGEA